MNQKFFDLKSEKQDRIINAALMIFALNGYKHASTDDIVKEAGISKGLLFHYFGSKSGLYSFLVDYSVKYLMYEYSRVIGEEGEYFAYHEKLMKAKTGVLQNYPYMVEFVQGAATWTDADCSDEAKTVISSYIKAMSDFEESLSKPLLREGVDMVKVNNMIKYISQGLTRESMESGNFHPEALYTQIVEYMGMIRIMAMDR